MLKVRWCQKTRVRDGLTLVTMTNCNFQRMGSPYPHAYWVPPNWSNGDAECGVTCELGALPVVCWAHTCTHKSTWYWFLAFLRIPQSICHLNPPFCLQLASQLLPLPAVILPGLSPLLGFILFKVPSSQNARMFLKTWPQTTEPTPSWWPCCAYRKIQKAWAAPPHPSHTLTTPGLSDLPSCHDPWFRGHWILLPHDFSFHFLVPRSLLALDPCSYSTSGGGPSATSHKVVHQLPAHLSFPFLLLRHPKN